METRSRAPGEMIKAPVRETRPRLIPVLVEPENPKPPTRFEQERETKQAVRLALVRQKLHLEQKEQERQPIPQAVMADSLAIEKHLKLPESETAGRFFEQMLITQSIRGGGLVGEFLNRLLGGLVHLAAKPVTA
jgi:hypothetical protein